MPAIPNIAFNHQKANQKDIEIINLDSLHARQHLIHSPYHPHRINFFNFLFIEAGEGAHMIDFERYSLSPGSMLFIQREQVHCFEFNEKIKGKIVLFTQNFLDTLHAHMCLPNFTPTHLNKLYSPQVKLDPQSQQRIANLLSEIEHEQSLPNGDSLIVMYLFSALAQTLHRLRPNLTEDKLSKEQSIRLARFFDLIQANFHCVRDASWYANQLNTTYKTLNQLCKAATGLTAKQMINSFSGIEMKRRLVVSNTTTQQLAYDFGFEDASNFIKYFKQLTGMTPTQFKQHYKP